METRPSCSCVTSFTKEASKSLQQELLCPWQVLVRSVEKLPQITWSTASLSSRKEEKKKQTNKQTEISVPAYGSGGQDCSPGSSKGSSWCMLPGRTAPASPPHREESFLSLQTWAALPSHLLKVSPAGNVELDRVPCLNQKPLPHLSWLVQSFSGWTASFFVHFNLSWFRLR